MIRMIMPPGAVGIAISLLATLPAQAMSDRVLVSAKSGADNPGCGAPATPCRTFQFAHNETNPGGQVSVMDPGEYGPVQITKSISIVNDGAGAAGVLGLSTPGAAVAIDAGPTDKVVLRGLAIESSGAGVANGVVLNSADSLTIANCVIRGFLGGGGLAYGVYIAPTTSASFSIADSLISKNYIGVRVWPQASVSVTGIVERVSANDNSFGVEILGPSSGGGATTVTIAKSFVSNNSNWGVLVTDAILSASDVVASNNGSSGSPGGAGFISTAGHLRLAHSTATGNEHGVVVNGGLVESYGDNDLRGNGTNVTGSLTAVADQ